MYRSSADPPSSVSVDASCVVCHDDVMRSAVTLMQSHVDEEVAQRCQDALGNELLTCRRTRHGNQVPGDAMCGVSRRHMCKCVHTP